MGYSIDHGLGITAGRSEHLQAGAMLQSGTRSHFGNPKSKGMLSLLEQQNERW